MLAVHKHWKPFWKIGRSILIIMMQLQLSMKPWFMPAQVQWRYSSLYKKGRNKLAALEEQQCKKEDYNNWYQQINNL